MLRVLPQMNFTILIHQCDVIALDVPLVLAGGLFYHVLLVLVLARLKLLCYSLFRLSITLQSRHAEKNKYTKRQVTHRRNAADNADDAGEKLDDVVANYNKGFFSKKSITR